MPPKRKTVATTATAAAKPAKRKKVEKVMQVGRDGETEKRGRLAMPGCTDSTTEESSSEEDTGKGEKSKGKGKGVDVEVEADEDDDDDEEEEEEWEDVLPTSSTVTSLIPRDAGEDLKLTLSRAPLTDGLLDGKKKGASAEQRRIRVLTHCMHVQFLLFHGWLRNRWVCDDEVQATLLSLLPARMAAAFERVREKKMKAAGKAKTDPLLQPLGVLLHWWRKRFTVDAPALRKRGYRSLRQFVDEREAAGEDVLPVPTGHKDVEGREVVTMVRREGETVDRLEGFRMLARECRGSRDIGALLLTGICRALGYEARVVFSLQPLGFGFSSAETAGVVTGRGGGTVSGNGTPKQKGNAKTKGKWRQVDSEEDDDDDELSSLSSLEDTGDSEDDSGKSSECKSFPSFFFIYMCTGNQERHLMRSSPQARIRPRPSVPDLLDRAVLPVLGHVSLPLCISLTAPGAHARPNRQVRAPGQESRRRKAGHRLRRRLLFRRPRTRRDSTVPQQTHLPGENEGFPDPCLAGADILLRWESGVFVLGGLV